MTWKLLLKEIIQKDEFGYEDKESVPCGIVAFDFKGKTDDTEFDLKKGEKVFYQHGTKIKLESKEYILVSLTSLICPKQ